MQRFKVYTLSLVTFILITTLAVGVKAPEALYNRYPVWADPLIHDEAAARSIEDAGVEVIWLGIEPGSHATIAVAVPRGGFTKEQAAAIGTAMGALGNQYNLQGQVLWIWVSRPANSWTVVGCNPAGCQAVQNDTPVDKNDWRRLIVDQGWVR